ncbi:hypothetical protein LU631_17855 [Erwinia tracheiphila]|uniref:Uncharacterized protein n=1 Tax=Erwinia tracheiphila TaxID=65700 RepID=A0A0M2K812_9GAMM|nr:hypothetical protein [Erwinia tracheiphila]EOS96376.1 hypothetical protein ETR_02999 [Erwinia tracheiphila PSU-1]AXF76312.1 hypothetical protein AV903_10080 [Erwinia tracheiphila]KKF35069.1 hypothetical protein SY86_05945 [Erwinia tracheiphila]UIA86726.1 hypothetical protein LU631_17855 [Erwinia tracheiphila]UIA95082.1 hypothetical protein LU633_16315 [Erwinia tracheiphila]
MLGHDGKWSGCICVFYADLPQGVDEKKINIKMCGAGVNWSGLLNSGIISLPELTDMWQSKRSRHIRRNARMR